MRKYAGGKNRGFTIVELLIVIVVIAILAAISLVVFNGIRARAEYTKASSDLASINKAIQAYHAEHGAYPPLPASADSFWVWSCDHEGMEDFIPALAESGSLSPNLPQAKCADPNPHNDSWLYGRFSDQEYKLLYVRPTNVGWTDMVPANMRDIRYDAAANSPSFGYWTSCAGTNEWACAS